MPTNPPVPNPDPPSVPATATAESATAPSDFIRDIVAADVAAGKYQKIITRFPPEPNGFLHVGHAKSICLNFGIAREFNGVCHLRMDDTNPTKEETAYVESILADIQWLIAGWADHCLGLKPKGATPQLQTLNDKPDFHLPAVTPRTAQSAQTTTAESSRPASQSHPHPATAQPASAHTNSDLLPAGLEPFYASDYFDALYEFALRLIGKGQAYVCDLTPEQTDQYRGAPDQPGRESPWRNRSIEENLELFQRMKAGEFPDGARTLRAKIDMAAPNVWLRDPVLYRIRHAAHHHTGNKWCIYPLYDFAHCLSDYIEGITHSICTLEFEVHRPLYDWILENLDLPRPLPHQYEFAKLIPSYTLVSKRRLIQLVNEKIVNGWDDPRMPTLSGIRRRGVTARGLRRFAIGVGVTKFKSLTDIALFEHAVREDLNQVALRRLAVLRPVKVVITNYPEDRTEELDAVNNPEYPNAGKRKVPFSRTLYLEADDFMESPPPKYFRLRPGGEVRLKYAYIIKCDEVIKDETGRVIELRCTADLDSKTGGPTANRKVKGTVHWVSAAHAIDAEARLYDRLFNVPEPDADGDFKPHLNPDSLEVVTAKCEPALREATFDARYQFERLGYFCLDKDSASAAETSGRGARGPAPSGLIFNRTIPLKDTWAKEMRK